MMIAAMRREFREVGGQRSEVGEEGRPTTDDGRPMGEAEEDESRISNTEFRMSKGGGD
jgi:hypothetical protein